MSNHKLANRAIPLIVLALVLLIGAFAFTPLGQRAQRFEYIVVKKLLVLNDTTLRGDLAQAGDQTITGDLTVTDDTTLGDAANDTLTVNGDVVITGIPDTVSGSYNEWVVIEGDMTGTGNKDRNFGLVIEMTRPAGEEIGTGDHLEAALKIAEAGRKVYLVERRSLPLLALRCGPSMLKPKLTIPLAQSRTSMGPQSRRRVIPGRAM